MSPIAELVRRSDPDRFFTSLFAPAETRETLLLLYAFNHELARAREVASQPMLAMIRLQWWREVVEGTHRRHEVAEPLSVALDAGALHRGDLLAMIDAREMEADDRVANRAAWLTYLEGAAGGLALAAGRVLGADAATRWRLRDLGAGYGVAGQLANVEVLAQRERCMLPEDVLAAHGLSAGHVIHDPGCVRPVALELLEDGEGFIRRGGGWFPRAVIAAALPAVLARRDLRHWARHGVPRPPGPRGAGCKLAVLGAALVGKV
jgi:phytoene synthase